MDHRLCRAIRMGLDDDRGLRVLGVKTLDIGSDRPEVYIPSSDPNSVSIRDLYNNALFIGILHVLIFIWTVNVQTNFFNKGRCYDKEDQHDEHHVQHGCQINLFVLFPYDSLTSTYRPLLALLNHFTRLTHLTESTLSQRA